MKIDQAVLAKTTTDNVKSKLMSNKLAELVFHVYITPSQYGELIEKGFDKQFSLEIIFANNGSRKAGNAGSKSAEGRSAETRSAESSTQKEED